MSDVPRYLSGIFNPQPKTMKLMYFPIMGRAEPIRMLLTHAQVEFEDERVSFEAFNHMKEDGLVEFGQLPVLIWSDGSPMG